MLNRLTVLLVDDSHDMLELLRRSMIAMGFNSFASDTVVDAIDILQTVDVDLVITDMNMPEISGMQLLRFISEHYSTIPVLVITGFPDVRNAVEVMKMGAMEYLIKPFTIEELESSVTKIIGEKKPPRIEESETLESFQGLIGKSNAMQKLYQTIDKIKTNRATVLITGESGTGKEVVARAIHYHSVYSSSPFVPVNCGAIPDQLLESELFGHIKGAFTGASNTRAGFFQAADGGTLFLDEISNASLAVQAKLLRVIQDKEITMLGATKSQKVDVRLISASNAQLNKLIEQGQFREDLYYRLNVIKIHIPPLRERKDDIPLLLNHFNQRYSKEYGKSPLKISIQINKILSAYHWPGNVRELENFVNRMVIMNDQQLNIDDIPAYMKMASPKKQDENLNLSLEEAGKIYIKKVLQACNNNKSKAAEILGIDRKTLREKLK